MVLVKGRRKPHDAWICPDFELLQIRMNKKPIANNCQSTNQLSYDC